MKTKIVYIIVCDETNYYLEQALISIKSLKNNNPKAEVTVITDNQSGEYIDRVLSDKKDITEIIRIKVPEKINNKIKSRYIKTQLRNCIEGDYLFIDTDTIITDSISEIDDWSYDIAAVLDKHLPISTHLFRDDIIKFSDLYEWSAKYDKYFNSGVMFVKDNEKTRKFYEVWHKYWLEGSEKLCINIDQPSLAKTNEIMGYVIQEISGIYNCQVNENGMKYFLKSKILHYFASKINNENNPFLFGHQSIYKEVRQNGVSQYIEDLLLNPKEAFMSKCSVFGGDECDVNRLPLVSLAKKVSVSLPSINKILRRFSLKRNIGR